MNLVAVDISPINASAIDNPIITAESDLPSLNTDGVELQVLSISEISSKVAIKNIQIKNRYVPFTKLNAG